MCNRTECTLIDLWCKVGVSKIHGVGIIALSDIPRGTVVTSIPEEYKNTQTIKYPVESFNVEQLMYLHSINCFDMNKGYVFVPETGFNIHWLQNFVNHSSTPNSIMFPLDCNFMQIITLNNIKSEEEITVDFTKAYPAHYIKGKKWAKK